MTTTTLFRRSQQSDGGGDSGLNRMSWFTYLVLTVSVLVSIFPFYWMFVVG